MDEILDLYVCERLSSTEIGKRYSVSYQTILNRLDEVDMGDRPRRRARKATKVQLDRETLRSMHCHQGLSPRALLAKLGANRKKLADAMESYGIERLKQSS